ncbi:S41 family peptidase [Brevundimonas lutea]|uniref:S41 family peptidase n=1 Tax=Brevundimonas lutea TaxID=2293980 RepID=UPI000F027AAD|nr:S41 family peptidase [Brevundimonas lutea]
MLRASVIVTLAVMFATPAAAQTAEEYRADAIAIPRAIAERYAYLDRLPDQRPPDSAVLDAEARAVGDGRALLAHAERRLLTLADHHAITGSSFVDSWGLVPTYSDLWVEWSDGRYRIDAVRTGSPAAKAGIAAGGHLVAVDGEPIEAAIAAFWADLGLAVIDQRRAFAARVLATGRRDRPRSLSIEDAGGGIRRVDLPNLYEWNAPTRGVVVSTAGDGGLLIVINDALGDDATIAAFDSAMEAAEPGQPITLDLSNTPSGGNTVVARAIMGWFVTRPTAYQIHERPEEGRRTGIPRRWIEQVSPRPGKFHDGSVTVRVGRWTGSMGEGLAIGFDALGARVVGDPMAGLLGAIEDHRLTNSGLMLKLPTERLYAVDGVAREAFRPETP